MWVLFIVYYLKISVVTIQRRQLKFPNYIQKIEKNIHTHVGNVNCMGNRYIMFTARARQSQMFSFHFLFLT